MKKMIIALIVTCSLAVSVSCVVIAQNTSQQHILSSKEISQKALNYATGKVYKIKLDNKKGDPVYVVSVMDKKAKYELKLNAKTGELLEKTTEYKTLSIAREKISLEKAKKIALKSVKGQILRAKLDKKDKVYEITIVKGKLKYEIEINAITGKIVSKEKKTAIISKAISLKKAKKIALNTMGGVVQQVNFNRDGGIYEIHVVKNKTSYKFNIDAYSGEIINRQSDGPTEPDSENGIGLEQVKQIAINTVGGAVTEANLDQGNNIYQVKVQNGDTVYDIEINANTGAVIRQEKQSASQTFASLEPTSIGIDKAKEIALSKIPGTITSANYNQSDGVYVITIAANGNEYTVELNAQTGEMVRQEQKENKVSNNSNESTIITTEQASQIALTKAKGTVTKINLVNNIYEVEVKDGTYLYAIKIDANTGDVLNFDKEYETKD
ncbi:PepSY domain-containing protein [Rummeliibacillus sp. JY-2-4R]